MDETSSLLVFEVMERVPAVAIEQNKRTPPLAFGAREGVVVVGVAVQWCG